MQATDRGSTNLVGEHRNLWGWGHRHPPPLILSRLSAREEHGTQAQQPVHWHLFATITTLSRHMLANLLSLMCRHKVITVRPCRGDALHSRRTGAVSLRQIFRMDCASCPQIWGQPKPISVFTGWTSRHALALCSRDTYTIRLIAVSSPSCTSSSVSVVALYVTLHMVFSSQVSRALSCSCPSCSLCRESIPHANCSPLSDTSLATRPADR